MTVNFLLDTNIFVYAYDTSALDKQRRAIEVLAMLATRGDSALTTQILAEFYLVATRKLVPPLDSISAYTRIERLITSWQVFDITSTIVLEAARGVRDHQMSFWDAQIWATARLNQIPVVLTENLPGTTTIEGVRFVNPFSTVFSL